jgi:hypothetical protein
MRNVIYAAVVLLAILHQDFWFWDDARIVLGFMPVGLAYHAAFAIVAALLWAAANRFAWPDRLENFAESEEDARRR